MHFSRRGLPNEHIHPALSDLFLSNGYFLSCHPNILFPAPFIAPWKLSKYSLGGYTQQIRANLIDRRLRPRLLPRRVEFYCFLNFLTVVRRRFEEDEHLIRPGGTKTETPKMTKQNYVNNFHSTIPEHFTHLSGACRVLR